MPTLSNYDVACFELHLKHGGKNLLALVLLQMSKHDVLLQRTLQSTLRLQRLGNVIADGSYKSCEL
jgi:hypothetical protein